jgi:Holliday junction resolvase RusA-like endonuclease
MSDLFTASERAVMEFTVLGVPQPQGSKVRGRFGGIHDDNKQLPAWRDSMLAAIRAAMDDTPTHFPILRPVYVEVDCYFPRPRSHYGTGRNLGIVRNGAPGKAHGQKPDLDKLLRALGDALTQSGAIRDDAQIAGWNARKFWADSAYMAVLVEEEP